MGCNCKPCCAGICLILAVIAIVIALVLPFWYATISKEETTTGTMKSKQLGAYGLSALASITEISEGCDSSTLEFICALMDQNTAGKPDSCKGKCDSAGGKGELTVAYTRANYKKMQEKEDTTGKTKCKTGEAGLAMLALALIMALGSGILSIVVAFKPMKPLKLAAVGLAAGALVFTVIGVAVGVVLCNPLTICVNSDSTIQKAKEDAMKEANNGAISLSAYIGFVALAEIIVALILLVVSLLMHNKETGFSQVDK